MKHPLSSPGSPIEVHHRQTLVILLPLAPQEVHNVLSSSGAHKTARRDLQPLTLSIATPPEGGNIALWRCPYMVNIRSLENDKLTSTMNVLIRTHVAR